MAQLTLDTQASPGTPAAGQGVLWPAGTGKRWTSKDDAGNVSTLPDLASASTAAVAAAYAADTYLAGSSIQIPRDVTKVATMYRCRFDMVKTGAGTAAATVIVRMNTNGTIADTARITFTFAVGTAVADTGIYEVFCHFRNVGAAAVLAGMCRLTHHLAATGLTTTGASGTAIILATSAGFDTTVNDQFIGISFNGGASFSGTNTVVEAELVNA